MWRTIAAIQQARKISPDAPSRMLSRFHAVTKIIVLIIVNGVEYDNTDLATEYSTVDA